MHEEYLLVQKFNLLALDTCQVRKGRVEVQKETHGHKELHRGVREANGLEDRVPDREHTRIVCLQTKG